MNFRLTAIFFGLVVLLVGTLLVATLVDQDRDAALTADGLLDPLARVGVTDRNVDTLELVRTEPAEERLVFVKTEAGRWELRDPFPAKVDGAAVDAVVRDLFRAKPVKYPELTDNLTVHGLDKPTLRATVRKGDQAATVNVGVTTIGGSNAVTFVTTSAAPNRPLAVRRTDLAGLFKDAGKPAEVAAEGARWLADYRLRKLLGADLRDPAVDAQAVKLSAGGKEVALTKSGSGAWTFTTPAGFGEADDLGESEARSPSAPLTGVRPLLTAVTGLQAGGADDYIEKPADLGQYGLKPDDPNVLRVELKGPTGPPEVVYLGKPVEENGKPVVPAKVYAKAEGDPAVVKVQTDRADALRATVGSPGDLRNKDVLPAARRDKIDAVDLTVGTDTVKLRKVAAGGAADAQWVLYGGGPSDPQEARRGEVEALLAALTRPRAAREVLPAPNDAAVTGAEVKATVKVWFDGVEKPEKVDPGKLPPEPKLKGNPVELVFGKKEGDAVVVRKIADGAKVDLKLPDAALAAATKTRLDLLDPKVKSFPTTQAVRVAFNRGAEQVDVTRADPAGTWTFEAPPGLKGKAADANKVGGLLGLLSALAPDRVAAEAPAPADLQRWALTGASPAGPRLKATVGLKDDPDKERTYEFGAETDDKKSVYARQAGRPGVFTVPKAVVDRFLSDDLRDPTVYRVDVAKVRRVKLRGWKGLVGPDPLVYLLEKKPDGTWAAVSPPTPAGFAPDLGKVAGLLAAVSAPRADAFVDVRNDPRYGLDVAQNPDGLEITLDQDNGPTVTLVLGSKTPDGKVYAASSGVPGEVFTLAPTAVRAYTDKPASLQAPTPPK